MSGFRRGSSGYTAQAGVNLRLGGTLFGEIAAGNLTNRIEVQGNHEIGRVQAAVSEDVFLGRLRVPGETHYVRLDDRDIRGGEKKWQWVKRGVPLRGGFRVVWRMSFEFVPRFVGIGPAREIVAVIEGRNRAFQRQDLQSMTRQIEIANDLRPQQTHDVRKN